MCGGKADASKLFNKEEYNEITTKSILLGMDEESYVSLMNEIEPDEYELIDSMRKIYDWSVLDDILNGNMVISEAKIKEYDEHKSDLRILKYFVKNYRNEYYKSVFKTIDEKTPNYVSYSGHYDNRIAREKKIEKFTLAKQEDFCKYIYGLFKDVVVEEKDINEFNTMI